MIGEVDQHKQIPIKFLFIDHRTGAWGEYPDDEGGTVCIRAADFITDQLRHSKNDLTRRKYTSYEIETRKLQNGDLIIEKSGGGDNQPVGRIVAFELDETALCSNFLERLRPDKSILHSKFGAYFLYSLWVNRKVIPFIKQTTGIQNLDIEEYFSQVVSLPPLPEQRAIAAYLDRETARLDVLLAALKRLLGLLAEKRQALISHAVTRGLNPAAPLRDSGMVWLGKIPAHWEVTRIKQIAKVGNGSTPLRDNNVYWQNGTFPWLTSTMVNDDVIGDPQEFVTDVALKECHLPIVEPNSVLIAITGQGKTRGKTSILRYKATINQHLAFITLLVDLVSPEYLQLFLSAFYAILRMMSEGMGSTKGALTCEQLKEFPVLVPPFEEQQEIVKYLEQQKYRIDKLYTIVQKMTGLLQERRAVLITEAVSGKLKVSR